MKLEQRDVEAKGWRWVPGMRIRGIDKLCVGVTAKGWPMYRDGYGRLSSVPHAQPDLTDPATIGCLLALVREAYDDDYLYASLYTIHNWAVYDGFFGEVIERGNSEAEALVKALEAVEVRDEGCE